MRLEVDPTSETGYRLVPEGIPESKPMTRATVGSTAEEGDPDYLEAGTPAEGTVRGVQDGTGRLTIEAWTEGAWQPATEDIVTIPLWESNSAYATGSLVLRPDGRVWVAATGIPTSIDPPEDDLTGAWQPIGPDVGAPTGVDYQVGQWRYVTGSGITAGEFRWNDSLQRIYISATDLYANDHYDDLATLRAGDEIEFHINTVRLRLLSDMTGFQTAEPYVQADAVIIEGAFPLTTQVGNLTVLRYDRYVDRDGDTMTGDLSLIDGASLTIGDNVGWFTWAKEVGTTDDLVLYHYSNPSLPVITEMLRIDGTTGQVKFSAPPNGPGAVQGMGSPIVVGGPGENTIEIGGLEIQAYGPTGDPYLLYLNFEGGTINFGKVDDTIQVMAGRIIQAWNNVTATDLTLNHHGGYVYIGDPAGNTRFEFRPGTGVFKLGQNAYISMGGTTDGSEMRFGVLNTADASVDYVRLIANAANKIKLIGAPNDMLIANLDGGAMEGIEFLASGQVNTYVAGVKQMDIRSGISYLVPAWDNFVTSGDDALGVAGSGGQLRRQSSSARFKTDVEPIIDASSRLMALEPVWFRSTIEADEGKSNYGFIAEQVEQVDRRFATYDNDECDDQGQMVPMELRSPVSINSKAILAHAVTVIQEQAAVIADLTARLDRIEEFPPLRPPDLRMSPADHWNNLVARVDTLEGYHQQPVTPAGGQSGNQQTEPEDPEVTEVTIEPDP